MKRAVSFFILGIALLAGGGWCLQCYLEQRETKQWRTLRDGRRVRFLAVTKGPAHQLIIPAPPLASKIREAVRTLSLAPLGKGPVPGPTAASDDNGIGVWLEIRGILKFDLPQKATLTLSDGRRRASNSGDGGGGPPGTPYYFCSIFDSVPEGQETLRYSGILDGEQIEFTFKSPISESDPPK